MYFFITQAYNAEKTLKRAVDSVLKQTFSDFVYYIIDNGSTDKTRAMILDYAENDKRVVSVLYNENSVHVGTPSPVFDVMNSISTRESNGYIATLDADDEYDSDFLMQMSNLIKKNRLDIAACGSRHINEQTGRPTGEKYAITHDLIIKSNGFNKHFGTYNQFTFTCWGKLFSTSVLKKCNYTKLDKMITGADTVLSLEAFGYAKRIGILGGTLHNYYLSPTSLIHQFDYKKIACKQYICDCMLAFLQKKNAFTPINCTFTYAIYANGITSIIQLMLRSVIKFDEKIRGIRDTVIHPHSQTLMKLYAKAEVKDILQKIIQEYIISMSGELNGELINLVAEIYTELNNIIALPNIQDDELFKFISTVYKNRVNKKKDVSVIEEALDKIINSHPILTGLSTPSLLFLNNPIYFFMQNNLQAALDEIVKIADTDIPPEYMEGFLLLAQRICALGESADGWIFFMKEWAYYLFNQHREEEAKQVLTELLEAVPNDNEIRNLSAILK